LIFPLIVIVQIIISQASQTSRKRITCFIISRPIKWPQQVEDLHKIVSARIPGIVVTRLLGFSNIDIRSKGHVLTKTLGKINTAGNTVKFIYPDSAVVFGV